MNRLCPSLTARHARSSDALGRSAAGRLTLSAARQGLNKQAVDTFLSGQLEQAVELTQEATVPALLQLSRSELAADRDAAEHIRNKWCNLLGQLLDGECRWRGEECRMEGVGGSGNWSVLTAGLGTGFSDV